MRALQQSTAAAVLFLLAGCGETSAEPSETPAEPANRVPVVTLAKADIEIPMGRARGHLLDVSMHFEDPDGDRLAYRITVDGHDETVARNHDTPAHLFWSVRMIERDGPRVTLKALRPRAVEVVMSATDPRGLMAADTFTATPVFPECDYAEPVNGYPIHIVFDHEIPQYARDATECYARRWSSLLAPSEIREVPSRIDRCRHGLQSWPTPDTWVGFTVFVAADAGGVAQCDAVPGQHTVAMAFGIPPDRMESLPWHLYSEADGYEWGSTWTDDLRKLIEHDFGHGFAVSWVNLYNYDLIQPEMTAAGHYAMRPGTRMAKAFEAMGGTGPLEMDIYSHWQHHDLLADRDVMARGLAPKLTVTLGALEDLGYMVDSAYASAIW